MNLKKDGQMGTKKQLDGKPRYHGRVDVSSCIDGVAGVRKVIIEDIKKYGEDMDLDMVSVEELVDANFRHTIAMQEDAFAVDHETGKPHLHHIQTNCMFIERKRRKKELENVVTECEVRNIVHRNVLSVPSRDRDELFKNH